MSRLLIIGLLLSGCAAAQATFPPSSPEQCTVHLKESEDDLNQCLDAYKELKDKCEQLDPYVKETF